MFLEIDFSSEKPIYLQIVDGIIKGIYENIIGSGYELPSVRAFANELGINLHTVNKSYSILKDRGYISIDRRRGAYVNEDVGKILEKEKLVSMDELECMCRDLILRGVSKEEIKEILEKL